MAKRTNQKPIGAFLKEILEGETPAQMKRDKSFFDYKKQKRQVKKFRGF